jgi:DNA end-binding protein Ku
MAHTLASASIAFGMVTIPVRLHTATRTGENISFNMLHGKCGSRLKQQYVCAQEGEPVERSEMVKGYEFSKGRYVIFSDEELKAFEEKATQAVEIEGFVPVDTVEPIYFEKSYYLSPGKGGERAYRLLAEAMRQTGRWAIARYAARGKNYLVCLRPLDGAIVMQQLYFSEQVRPVSELEIPEIEIRDQELKMAVQLTELGAADRFVPENYRDEARSKMRELIEKKVAGEEITQEPEEAPRAQVVDLMEALRASLAAAGGTSKPAASAPAAAKRERKPAKRASRATAAPAKTTGAKKKSSR